MVGGLDDLIAERIISWRCPEPLGVAGRFSPKPFHKTWFQGTGFIRLGRISDTVMHVVQSRADEVFRKKKEVRGGCIYSPNAR